jgi:hypothetical protein
MFLARGDQGTYLEEHKSTWTSGPKNIFLNMNVSPEEHKKLMNECLFLIVYYLLHGRNGG